MGRERPGSHSPIPIAGDHTIRHALTTLALALTAVAGSTVAATPVTLFKSPWCGCCESYARYLRNQGFEVKTIDQDEMDAVKKRHGTDRAASCHTSLIGGYVIEGHVPAQTIRKLLAERPQIAGISLPGMPASSPGMGPATKGSLQIFALPLGAGTPRPYSVE